MDYSTLSDFEINKAVAESLGVDHVVMVFGLGDDALHAVFTAPFRGVKIDYCNNPADAWPIIAENKISLSFDDIYMVWNAYDTLGDHRGRALYSNTNPLRAAMIVYLMMNEQ